MKGRRAHVIVKKMDRPAEPKVHVGKNLESEHKQNTRAKFQGNQKALGGQSNLLVSADIHRPGPWHDLKIWGGRWKISAIVI